MTQLYLLLLSGLMMWQTAAAQNADTIKVMHYNLLNYGNFTSFCTSSNNNINTKDTDFKTIAKHVNPDILTVNEMGSNAIYAQRIKVNVLNTDGVSRYEQAVYSNGTGSNGSSIVNMLFYNKDKLALHSQFAINTSYRVTDVYTLYHKTVSATDTVFLHIVVTHLKAGSSSSDASDRAAMTQTIMNELNQRADLGNATANMIICGDFNVKTSSEQGYQNLITHSNERIRFRDPVNRPGNWTNNAAFADLHTQSTRSSGSCHAGGGSDDRFDFILANNTVINDSAMVQYITSSYATVGQDGNHFNKSINASPTNTSAPVAVINALYGMSDHLPVALDLRFDLSTISALADNMPHNGPEIMAQNPVENTLSIYLKNHTGNWQYTVTDLTGRRYISGEATDDNIRIAFEAPAGLYILVVTTQQGQTVRKLIKQ